MAGSVETELKLRLLNADSWRDILHWKGWSEVADTASWRHENLEAQYFDTPDHDLRQVRLTYRIRRENGKWVAAVKGGGTSEGGLHQRSEWEVCIPEPVPCVSYFADTPIGPSLAEEVGDQPLYPLFTTRFERHILLVYPDEQTVIEVAVDRGAIIVGDAQEPIQEIELELKAGNVSALLTLGAALARDFPLLFEEGSKYYRGLVAAGLAEKAVKTRVPHIDKVQPACLGAKELILHGLFSALRGQARFLDNMDDPERLHKVKIKLRRLRAFLSFAKPLTQEQQCKDFNAALREWGHLLGPVRDIDMLLETWQQLEHSGAVAFEGHRWLGDVLSAERRTQMERMRAQLSQMQSTALFLSLWAWLEGEAWQCDTQQSFHSFCVSRLENWFQTLADFGKKTDLSDAENIRKLRITCKKLRYVLEQLDGSLDFAADELVERLKQLQDSLGYLRDAKQTSAVLNSLLADRSSRAVHREAGMLMGWQARSAVEKERGAHKAWRRLRRRLLKHLKNMYV